MSQYYTDEDVRLQLARVKEAVDAAVASEDRGPRRALLAALQESVTRSVGMCERLASAETTAS
jgi:hypothetical protein